MFMFKGFIVVVVALLSAHPVFASIPADEPRFENLARMVRVHLDLRGSEESPPVESSARGHAMLDLDPETGALFGLVKFSRFTSKALSAHIHLAPVGLNGPAILVLVADQLKETRGSFMVPDKTFLTKEQVEAFLKGELYINVHSVEHPNGEIRGQIIPGHNVFGAIPAPEQCPFLRAHSGL